MEIALSRRESTEPHFIAPMRMVLWLASENGSSTAFFATTGPLRRTIHHLWLSFFFHLVNDRRAQPCAMLKQAGLRYGFVQSNSLGVKITGVLLSSNVRQLAISQA